MSSRPIDTSANVFYIRYRKWNTIGGIFLLLGFPFEIYRASAFGPGHTSEAIGDWLNAFIICLAVPLWLLMHTQKVNKAYQQEMAELDKKSE